MPAFDLAKARETCEKSKVRTERIRSMLLGFLAEHPICDSEYCESVIDAAEMLPAAIAQIEELSDIVRSQISAVPDSEKDQIIFKQAKRIKFLEMALIQERLKYNLLFPEMWTPEDRKDEIRTIVRQLHAEGLL